MKQQSLFNKPIKQIKFIDLFAGLGGLRIGLEQACNELNINAECVLTSEIKPHALSALQHNFKEKISHCDITQINEDEIPDFDILLAGFPCQSFSSAGNRDGFEDTRGTLFFDIARIIKHKKPNGFILENVEGLVKHNLINKNDNIGKTLTIILNTLQELGYKTTWSVLDSQNFGLAQSRKRIYIVGSLNKQFDFAKLKNIPNKNFGDIQEKNIDTVNTKFTKQLISKISIDNLYGMSIKDKRGGNNNIHSWDLELKGEVSISQKKLLNTLLKERRKKQWAIEIGIDWMDGMPLTSQQISTFFKDDKLEEMLIDLTKKGYLKLEHPKKKITIITDSGNKIERREYDTTKPKGYNIVAGKLSFEFSKILHPNEITPTLVASDVEKIGVIDNGGIRNLTLREGLRLFGYPETYSLNIFNNKSLKRKGFDLLGNTVSVPIIYQISKELIKTLDY